MKNLLKLEFYKLKRRKSFYICTAIILLELMLNLISTNSVLKDDPFAFMYLSATGIECMQEAAYISSFTLIAGIFVVLFVCEDFEQQTVKNIVAKGYTRVQIFLAKAVAVWASASAMFVLCVLFAFCMGTLFFGVGDIYSNLFSVMVAQYLAAMAELAAAFFLAFLLRKNGRSIAAYIMASVLGSLALALADIVLEFEKVFLADYWYPVLLGTISYLPVDTECLTRALIASPLYIAVFFAAGLFLSRKTEL